MSRKRSAAPQPPAELSPLDYMLSILRDEAQSQDARMWAAEKAAPYTHSKLATVQHTGADGEAIPSQVKVVLSFE